MKDWAVFFKVKDNGSEVTKIEVFTAKNADSAFDKFREKYSEYKEGTDYVFVEAREQGDFSESHYEPIEEMVWSDSLDEKVLKGFSVFDLEEGIMHYTWNDDDCVYYWDEADDDILQEVPLSAIPDCAGYSKNVIVVPFNSSALSVKCDDTVCRGVAFNHMSKVDSAVQTHVFNKYDTVVKFTNRNFSFSFVGTKCISASSIVDNIFKETDVLARDVFKYMKGVRNCSFFISVSDKGSKFVTISISVLGKIKCSFDISNDDFYDDEDRLYSALKTALSDDNPVNTEVLDNFIKSLVELPKLVKVVLDENHPQKIGRVSIVGRYSFDKSSDYYKGTNAMTRDLWNSVIADTISDEAQVFFARIDSI